MPDIFWDGIVPVKQIIFGQPDEEKIVLEVKMVMLLF